MAKEELTWVLYDTMTLNNNTADFFQNSEGTAGLMTTNMPAQGQLGNWAFKVHRIGVSLDASASVADIQGFLNNSALRLEINGQRYFEALCLSLPAGGGITGTVSIDNANAAATTTVQALTNGEPSFEALYPIRELMILPNTPFVVRVRTSYAVNTRVRVTLHGILIRDKN